MCTVSFLYSERFRLLPSEPAGGRRALGAVQWGEKEGLPVLAPDFLIARCSFDVDEVRVAGVLGSAAGRAAEARAAAALRGHHRCLLKTPIF